MPRPSNSASRSATGSSNPSHVAPAIIVSVVLMAAVTGYAWWESIR
jgi:hypothetical protein